MSKDKPPSKSTSEEYQNFERFTKALLAVPKKEIDKQKAEYERKKAEKKKKAA